jgi:hypothetical protein
MLALYVKTLKRNEDRTLGKLVTQRQPSITCARKASYVTYNNRGHLDSDLRSKKSSFVHLKNICGAFSLCHSAHLLSLGPLLIYIYIYIKL